MDAINDLKMLPLSEKNQSSKLKDIDSELSIRQSSSGKVSLFEAAVHLFKGSVGAGLFAMGDCFKNGGLIGAIVLMPFIAAIAVHCDRILINSSSLMATSIVQKTDVGYYDYPQTVQKCFEYGPKRYQRFGRPMKLIVEILLSVAQFGFCAVYFVFITKNLHQVLQHNGLEFSEYTVALITLLPALLPSLMTNLKLIAPVSLLASFFMIFGMLATLTIAIMESQPMPALSERKWTTNLSQMALFFGTAQFAFEGVAVILPLRNSMKDPEKFIARFGVLNLTVVFTTIIFILTGFISYLRWGDDVQGIITLNLDPENLFSQCVKIIAASGVYLGIPIQFMVLIETLWPKIENSCSRKRKNSITLEVIFRFALMMMIFGAARIVPRLSVFMSLLGALCSTSLAIVIPVLIDFVIKSQIPNALNTIYYMKNTLILAVGLLGVIVGTYQSLLEVIESFKN